MSAPKPADEDARLAALLDFEILDTDPEIGFDDLTLLAASICEAPISAVTLIDADRQWFKSRVGMDAPETPLEYSFCAYAILQPETLVIEDAAHDATFADNPAVTPTDGVRFYAGTPLVTPEGFALGTLCVADRVPRQLRPEQLRALEALSRQVMTQMELRRRLRDLRRATVARERAEAQNALHAAEVARDLEFARQFQQSLLPDDASYPAVPTAPLAPLRLSFHHIYQPAMSLGGDFFDVLKLSEHRAGIFIADVMGHGARSALVTAILRTLFQEMAHDIADPGQLLTQLNARFASIVRQSDQFLFVSAFYLVVDTEAATVDFASAGHPAPVRADRSRRHVGLLQTEGENGGAGAALGLAPDSVYETHSAKIRAGDVFLLFTDGLVEAPDTQGEEWGEERLCELVAAHPGIRASRLVQLIVDAVNDFTGATTRPDDLCLVAVEVVCD